MPPFYSTKVRSGLALASRARSSRRTAAAFALANRDGGGLSVALSLPMRRPDA
jgi:hypothetical protein